MVQASEQKDVQARITAEGTVTGGRVICGCFRHVKFFRDGFIWRRIQQIVCRMNLYPLFLPKREFLFLCRTHRFGERRRHLRNGVPAG